MDELLQSCGGTLTTLLELRSGALNLISTIKKMGKKIVVKREGSQDTQQRTVESLGIGSHIDFLATTNQFGLTKTSGHFPKVLGYLRTFRRNMVYLGDNEERDMKPAMAEGIFLIHLDEKNHVSLISFPPQINTLTKLHCILAKDDL